MTGWPVPRQVISFGVIGLIGFLVDGGVLTLLNSFLSLDLFLSRLFSSSIAITVTWFLNRRYTFSDRKDKNALREWVRYAFVNGLGAFLNLSIFFWLVLAFSVLASAPIVPLAFSSAAALFFNFLVSKYVAFRGPRRL
jgi:putative flippase GtrA